MSIEFQIKSSITNEFLFYLFFFIIYIIKSTIYTFTDNNKYWKNNRLSFIFLTIVSSFLLFKQIKNSNHRLIQEIRFRCKLNQRMKSED